MRPVDLTRNGWIVLWNRRPGDSGIAPVTDRSFCCWVISATSERLVFTVGAGVELAVRVVSSGPFGPPIPGGGSFTSRLNPRSNPPPFARPMSVCAIRGRYRSTSISKLFSRASAIASANERYNWPARIRSKIRSEF